jgi:glycine oxidase
VEYARTGVLDLARDEGADESLRDKVHWLREAGHDVSWLNPIELLSVEPAVTPGVYGAFFDADAYQIHPSRFTQALAQGAGRRDVSFTFGCEVTGVERAGSRITAIHTTDGSIAAGHVVVATGAWSAAAGEWLGVQLPVFPAKGQILTVRAVPNPIRNTIFGYDAYLLPRVDGTIVVGATVERAGFDKSLTADGVGRLLTTIPSLCPALRNAPIERMWTGLRPASSDEMPIVGLAPGWDNVALATAHYRNGIMLAPITARLVTDLILRGTSSDLLVPLDPGRFVPA